MEQYRTEEEQVEALRRWWKENSRSLIAAIILALGVGFGWQGWKQYDQDQREGASQAYQRMLQALGAEGQSAQGLDAGIELAEQLKLAYSGSTYAQFAALQLARIAVDRGDLADAQAQLRWVLGKADKGSDTALVAQLRLARVLAASGDPEQALTILEQAGEGPYKASYALARGDILLSLGRRDAALQAYNAARVLAERDGTQAELVALQQKIQALNPVPVRRDGSMDAGEPAAAGTVSEQTATITDQEG